MSYRYITLNVADQVATLTLNRPEVHNAFDDVMIGELLDAFDTIEQHQDCRMVVLASTGRNFSAGADLGWMRSMADKNYDENIADAKQLAQLMERLDQLSKPTLALVQGAAFGGAVGLAACCDIVLAEERSSFCLSEVKIGLIPAVISPYVMRAIGTRQARRYMLTAERFAAPEALQMGLVHEIVSDFDSALERYRDTLLSNSPAAVTAAKQLIADLDQQPIDAPHQRLTIERIAEIRVSSEGQEGLSAFLEKRSPNWKKDSQ
ncbi:enoyl-CoA hydratase/isomerase family protein [Pseudidiomarina sp. 1ASP75-14]|uniref:enoyl-CoA hydratase/isomerase family protein n=1 Tax=Pseudidiomarina terrestris TaxID=2820060 RepID=UPI00264B4517|nr:MULTISPECIES: enoyl-CoA hydratase/isomerase family protein [unclassified Pseudidiomarina]MDN7126687.1 enoyl-CoA hydratase/isomerase family protein [Pseudidiomarina sp. 1APR75-33.1]MDN7137659.1 enoyl-CoA hydratase/isomerase family protein [Pseudidiomarina sp. 1ASP75-14]